jgi:hypothetical protein
MLSNYATSLRDIFRTTFRSVLLVWFPASMCVLFSVFMPTISLYKDQFDQFFIQYAFLLSQVNIFKSSIISLFMSTYPIVVAYISVIILSCSLTFSTITMLRGVCVPRCVIFALTMLIFVTPLLSFSISMYRVDSMTTHTSLTVWY